MKKLLSFLFAVIMISGAAAAAIPAYAATAFSDVEADRWSAPAIEYAALNGYMNGVGGDRFDPDGSLTRAMVAAVLWRREGSPAPSAPSGFYDVPEDGWYADAVAWAREAGVVMGIGGGIFDPERSVTREALATMLFRYSSTAPVSVPERADLHPFADGENVSGWATEPVGWAVEAGLIEGTDENRLAPYGGATREQFAAMIERYDRTFKLEYNEPVPISNYTEPESPLADNADLYVATDGDDGADGSFDHPLATWNEAVLRVRDIKKTKTSGDIIVAFKAGDYGPLSLTLTAEDSGGEDQRIVYCKYGDGDVVFNNGFDVGEDEFLPLDESDKAYFSDKNAGHIKKADVSDRLGAYDPGRCLILSGDGALTLARFPNLYEDGTDNLIQAGVAYDPYHIHVRNTAFKKRIDKYHTTDGLILYGYIATGWYRDAIGTDGYEVDPETGNYVFFIPHPESVYWGFGPQLGDGFATDYFQMAILNVSEELDTAGEYWIDEETGTFYVYDPSGDYCFPDGGGMITMGKVRNITLLGLDFKNSAGHMISACEHPRDLTIDRCSFSGCAAQNMIDVRGTDSGMPLDLLVTGCSFSLSACTALYVESVDPDDLFHTGTGVVVDNNYFTLTNLQSSFWSAITVDVPGPVVTHNYFEKCYWTCVGFGNATDMIAEYNVFDEPVCNGDDAGAFGQGTQVFTCGNVIRNNLFMNIKGGYNGRFGVYLDDAIGVEVYSNLFYNVDVSVMNNDISKYNTFCSNVTVKGPEVCDYRYNHTLAVIEAMTTGREDIILNSGSYKRWVDGFAYFDSHPAIKEEAMRKWPELFTFTTDLSRWREREFCENSSLVITGNRSFNETAKQPEFNEIFAQYSTIEDNIAYSFGENPLFVNPTVGDYRIREGVDFPDIRFEKIGRY